MTDSYALLAGLTTDGKRTAVLRSDEGDFSVRGTVMHADGRHLLLVRAWLDEAHYTYVAVDDRGFLLAMVRGLTHELTYPALRKELERRGLNLDAQDNKYSLLADHVQNGRRTSVLR